MKKQTTNRGFQRIILRDLGIPDMKIQQASWVGSGSKPGSSYLLIGREGGEGEFLSRKMAEELMWILDQWLETGRLFEDDGLTLGEAWETAHIGQYIVNTLDKERPQVTVQKSEGHPSTIWIDHNEKVWEVVDHV